MKDPLNHRLTPNGLGAFNHSFSMPGHSPTPLARRHRDKFPRGRVTRHKVETSELAVGTTREVFLYEPPVTGPYPLMVVLDGTDYMRRASLPTIMDNLIREQRIRDLISRQRAVSCDETPLKVGPKAPKPGKQKAEQYLLVTCTDRYTHYLLGDRSLDTFKASALADLPPGTVIVHDRYQNRVIWLLPLAAAAAVLAVRRAPDGAAAAPAFTPAARCAGSG